MVFNADKTELNWKVQPWHLAQSELEKNFKVAKDHVTVLVCANTTGKCKTPFAFVHKYTKPNA